MRGTTKVAALTAGLISFCRIPAAASFSGLVARTKYASSLPRGITTNRPFATHQRRMTLLLWMIPHYDVITDSSTLWTSDVTVFDGSTIVDPVVVSNVFWANIQSKIVVVLVGQLIATVIFCLLATIFASQATKWGEDLANFLRETKRNKKGLEQTQPQQPSIPQVAAPLRKTQQQTLRLATIQPDFGKLLICVVIDVLGTSSELIPLLGEASDIIWAPVAGFLLRSLFGSNILFALEFIEEILPFTDVLPLATLTWVVDTFFADSTLAQVLQVGMFHPRVNGTTASFSPLEREENTREQILLPRTKDQEDDTESR